MIENKKFHTHLKWSLTSHLYSLLTQCSRLDCFHLWWRGERLRGKKGVKCNKTVSLVVKLLRRRGTSCFWATVTEYPRVTLSYYFTFFSRTSCTLKRETTCTSPTRWVKRRDSAVVFMPPCRLQFDFFFLFLSKLSSALLCLPCAAIYFCHFPPLVNFFLCCICTFLSFFPSTTIFPAFVFLLDFFVRTHFPLH